MPLDKFVTLVVEGVDGGYPHDEESKGALRLIYDFNKVVDAEDVAKCHLLRALSGPANAKEMRGILYALLRTAQPSITIEEAGSLLSVDPVGVTEALRRCLNAEYEGA